MKKIKTVEIVDTPTPVVISTWQSVYTLPKQFFQKFKVVYGDEAHLFKAKSLTTIMHKMTDTPFRVGTTGTLDGTKTHKLVLEGLFGPVYKVTTTKELMDKDQLANLKIYCVILQYTDEVKKANKDNKYPEEMDFLVQYETRNKFIRNLALDQKGNTLVLFQFVEKHGKILFDMIHDKNSERKVFFVYGGTDTEQREQIRKITNEHQEGILLTFGDKKLNLPPETPVLLSDNSYVAAANITLDTDINDAWIDQNYEKWADPEWRAKMLEARKKKNEAK